MLIVGIGLITYPKIDSWIQEHKQLELLTEWSQETHKPLADLHPSDQEEEIDADVKPLPQWKEVDGSLLLGSLSITAIDLKEPIVHGTDAISLKEGAGSVVEDRLPGQSGNFVLAGHRSWTEGRHFNRLGELETGDFIDIDTSAGSFHYKVTETELVLPSDLSVLNNDGDEALLTLITCHPKRNPTHRLIIKAKLQL